MYLAFKHHRVGGPFEGRSFVGAAGSVTYRRRNNSISSVGFTGSPCGVFQAGDCVVVSLQGTWSPLLSAASAVTVYQGI